MRSVRVIAVLVACAAIAYSAYRLVVHESRLHPAIVTPQMDAQQEVSPSLAGRVKRLFREQVSYNRPNRPRLIALTFDDGPYPIFTPLLLNELNSLNIHATFFLIGRDAQQWPELARRIERSGDEIADHTQTHPALFDRLPDAQVRQEILSGRDSLESIVHDPATAKFFRPPHGRYTLATIEVAQSLGYTTVLWHDDAGDWRTTKVTAADLTDHLRRYATAPDIVLLHSGKLATIEMLPQVARAFRAAGYRFVTVGQLLAAVPTDQVNHPGKGPV